MDVLLALVYLSSLLMVTSYGLPAVTEPPILLLLDARFISLEQIKITWDLTPHNTSTHRQIRQQVAFGHDPDCDKRNPVDLAIDIREYVLVTEPGVAVLLCLRTASQGRTSHWVTRDVLPDIRSPPVILSSHGAASEQIYVDRDDLEPIPCRAVGIPKPVITWYKDSQQAMLSAQDNVTISASGELIIHRALAHHEGVYFCVANNSYGRAISQKIRLIRASIGRFPTSRKSPQFTVEEGQHLKLECRGRPASVPAENTQLIWKKGEGRNSRNVQLSDRVIQGDDGTLLFVYTKASDSGVYMCMVENSYVEVSNVGSRIEVDINARHISPHEPRKLYPAYNGMVYAFLGQPFTMQCVFSGNPPPHVTWFHDGFPITASDWLVLSDHDTSLTVTTNVSAQGHDKFQCQGQNDQGSSEKLDIKVLYHDPPSFETAPTSINATTGDNVTFECVPKGTPLPHVSWYIDGIHVPILQRELAEWKIQMEHTKLHINLVNKEDIMNVQCNISNPHGAVYTNVYLNVFDPPLFVHHAEDQLFSADTTYDLPCEVESDPGLPLRVYWLLNDSIINTTNRIYVDKSHTLRLDAHGLESDSIDAYIGDYTCVGDNSIAKRAVTARLMQPTVRVPKDVFPLTQPSVERKQSFFNDDNVWWMIAAGLGIFVVVALTITICMVKRKKSLRAGSETNLSDMTHLSDRASRTSEQAEGRYGSVCTCRSNSTYSHIGSSTSLSELVEDLSLRTTLQEVYIDRNRLELGEVIGKGQFGRVYAAFMFNMKGQYDDKVAVKTLKYKAEETEMVELFLREAVMMKDFSHPHVLSLIGITFDCDTSPMVVLPFMANGDLKQHIQDPDKEITILELLKFSLQVAKGMVYLSQKRFVHRDLACRNCMVDDHEIVRVADFGLSRDLFSRDYYRIEDGKTPLPVRWMAPECLQHNVFTSMSDVWSFGILLWELMTRGATPFPDLDNWDVPKHIKTGRHLPQPAYCPDAVYCIMTQCWAINQHDRTTFEKIVSDIGEIVHSAKAGQTDHNRNLYINIATAVVARPDYRQTTV